MSIYGEGLYEDADGNLVENAERQPRNGTQGWDPLDERGRPLKSLPTPEWKQPSLTSIYALGKYVQERQTLIMTNAYGMEGTCLRLFNVYGPGQALSNPYTGVLAIFSSRLLNGEKPMIFEDGEQRRDFVSVHDVVQACRLALEVPEADGGVFNIGSGRSVSVLDVARIVGEALGVTDTPPDVTEKGRVGDIRHCFADITRARAVLGYEPRVKMEEGVLEVAEWVAGEAASDDVQRASAELAARGLTI
jgi:dTDP-L-rhamnose 4-epimerase